MDPVAELSDIGTSASRLAEIARDHPELRDAVAAHPAAYPALLDWIAAQAPTATPTTDVAPAPHPSGVVRRVIGVSLILAGAAIVIHQVWRFVFYGVATFSWPGLEGTETVLAAVGYGVFTFGWLILPGGGARRAVSTVLALTGLWLLANSLGVPYGRGSTFGLVGVGFGYAGPSGGLDFLRGEGFAFGLVGMSIFKALAFTLVAAAWLVARGRPPRAYTVLVMPLVAVFSLSAFAPGPMTMGLGWGGVSSWLASYDVSPLAQLLHPLRDYVIAWLGSWAEFPLLTLGVAIGWLVIVGGTGWLAARMTRQRTLPGA